MKSSPFSHKQMENRKITEIYNFLLIKLCELIKVNEEFYRLQKDQNDIRGWNAVKVKLQELADQARVTLAQKEANKYLLISEIISKLQFINTAYHNPESLTRLADIQRLFDANSWENIQAQINTKYSSAAVTSPISQPVTDTKQIDDDRQVFTNTVAENDSDWRTTSSLQASPRTSTVVPKKTQQTIARPDNDDDDDEEASQENILWRAAKAIGSFLWSPFAWAGRWISRFIDSFSSETTVVVTTPKTQRDVKNITPDTKEPASPGQTERRGSSPTLSKPTDLFVQDVGEPLPNTTSTDTTSTVVTPPVAPPPVAPPPVATSPPKSPANVNGTPSHGGLLSHHHPDSKLSLTLDTPDTPASTSTDSKVPRSH